MRIPLALIGPRFGFSVVDADDSRFAGRAVTLRGDADPAAAIPGLLVYSPANLIDSLDSYRESGKRSSHMP